MKKATLDLQSSTARSRLHLALELSAHSWKLCFSDGKRIRLVTIKAEAYARLGLEIGLAKDRFGLAEEAPVSSCYEAGRDGFWIHRYLTSLGVESVVVEPASIQVERRARRVKTDRLDAKRLLQLLVRHASTHGRRQDHAVPQDARPDLLARRRAGRRVDSGGGVFWLAPLPQPA